MSLGGAALLARPATSGAPRAVAAVAESAPRRHRAERSVREGVGPRAASSATASSPSFEAAIAGEDPYARIRAVDEAVARRDTSAIPALARMPLAEEDPAARTLIHALGKLGAASSDPAMRRAAADRLGDLLREEHARKEPDPGNVLLLASALADVRDPSAAPLLEEELGRAPLRTAGWTAIARALADAGRPESVPALERTRALVASSAPATDFDRAVQKDFIEAADLAIVRLSRM
jgi:hypothetical protein